MLLVEYEMRERGMTQTEIGKQCGVTASLVCRVVRGAEKPYPKLRDGIAKALGWSLDRTNELFEEIIDVKTRSGWLRGDAE